MKLWITLSFLYYFFFTMFSFERTCCLTGGARPFCWCLLLFLHSLYELSCLFNWLEFIRFSKWAKKYCIKLFLRDSFPWDEPAIREYQHLKMKSSPYSALYYLLSNPYSTKIFKLYKIPFSAVILCFIVNWFLYYFPFLAHIITFWFF